MSLRPWKRGPAAQRAANLTVPPAGELGVETDTGNLVVADGSSTWAALKRLVRIDEVTAAVQQYVTSLVVTNSSLAALATESGYLYAWLDQNGRLALGVKPDGTVVAKLALTNGLVDYPQLSAAVAAAVPVALPPESGYIWAVTGTGGRILLAAAPDGTVTIPKPALGAGSVDTPQLSAALQSTINTAARVPLPVESGYLWAVVDQNNRLLIGGTPDGTIVAKGITIADGAITLPKLSTDVAARLNPAAWPRDVVEVAGASPNRRLYANLDATGTRVALTDGTVDSYNPRITRDGAYVLYDSAAGPMYVPIAGGTPHQQTPAARVSMYGDSLTYSNGGKIEAALAAALGVTVDNRGNSGWASSDIAMLQGGLSVGFTFAGQIPADNATAVAVTPQLASSFRNNGTGPLSWAGSFAGIPGALRHNQGSGDAGGWTFTRTTAGAATTVPDGTPFVPSNANQAGADENNIQVLWVGRNNIQSGEVTLGDVARDVAAMVSYLKPYHKRYLVISVTNALGETRGTSTYNSIIAANAALAAAYGPRYLDLRSYLINQALADMGLTPTAQDLADVANDTIPTQLHAAGPDAIHFTDATYQQIGAKLAAIMQSKGWA